MDPDQLASHLIMELHYFENNVSRYLRVKNYGSFSGYIRT